MVYLIFGEKSKLLLSVHFILVFFLELIKGCTGISNLISNTPMNPGELVNLNLENTENKELEYKNPLNKKRIWTKQDWITNQSSKINKTYLRFLEQKDNQFDYLLIPDTQKYCEGSTIVLVANSIKHGVNSLQASEQLCNSIENCDFFSFSGSETKNRINSGMSWLCYGDGWLTTVAHKSWVTAVKSDYIQLMTPNYITSVNMRMICPQDKILSEVQGVISPKLVAKTCDNDPRCTHFTISFSSSSPDPINQPAQVVYYCSGELSKSVPSNGWISAVRTSSATDSTGDINPKTGFKYGSPVAAVTHPVDQENKYGPVTQDDYYDSKKKGTIVLPIKMGA